MTSGGNRTGTVSDSLEILVVEQVGIETVTHSAKCITNDYGNR